MRYFKIRINSGADNNGLFNIYYDNIDPMDLLQNLCTIYDSNNSSNLAQNITYGQLTSVSDFIVIAPDSTQNIIVLDTVNNCEEISDITPNCLFDAEFSELSELTFELCGTCGLEMTISSNLTLSAGELTSDTCHIEDYVIDWHLGNRDGEVVFTSAKNLGIGIDAQHPFENEVVVSGELHPVIRYVIIDSQKYTPTLEIGSLHSPDLKTCLPETTVSEIDCGTINLTSNDPNYDGIYDVIISREVGIGSPNRTFTFTLSENTNFFAWSFQAFVVPDELKIFYCTQNDNNGVLVDYMRFSSNNINYNPVDYPNNPIIPGSSVKYVTDLRPFTYQLNDFLRIEINGLGNSILGDTKWLMKFKCLDELEPLPDMSPTFNKIGDTLISSAEPNCLYSFEYPIEHPISTYTNYQQSDFRKYFNIGTNNSVTIINGKHQLRHTWEFGGSFNKSIFSGVGSCAVTGNIKVTKTGLNITWDFSSTSDYDLFKSNYDTIVSNSEYLKIVNNTYNPNTDVEYYGSFRPIILTGLGGCDTSIPSLSINVSLFTASTNKWVFDNVNKKLITVTLMPLTNSLQGTNEDCADFTSSASLVVNSIMNTINLPDFEYTFNKRLNSALLTASNYGKSPVTNQQEASHIRIVSIQKRLLNGIYSPSNELGFVDNVTSWVVYSEYAKTKFTNVSSHTTRLVCWELYRSLFFTTKVNSDLATYELIESGTCEFPTVEVDVTSIDVDYVGSGFYNIAVLVELKDPITNNLVVLSDILDISVKIPVFEGSNSVSIVPISAIISIQPGTSQNSVIVSYQNTTFINDTSFSSACIDDINTIYSGPEELIFYPIC